MTYADKLLADGERVVLRRRQHWMSLVQDSIRGWLLWLLALAVLAIILVARPSSDVANAGGLVAIVVFGGGLIIVVWQYMLWRTEEYLVTNRRLMKVSGVINKRSADSSLEKINDAILTQGMWARVFNYGDLDILTAADTPVDQYRMLAAAPDFKKTMLNEKHNLELELSGGYIPSAPLRADLPPAPVQQATPPPMEPTPAGPPPAAPPPAAPPVDTSLEVTQTLARLADLRDQGAITPEDYEAKKAELLSRL